MITGKRDASNRGFAAMESRKVNQALATCFKNLALILDSLAPCPADPAPDNQFSQWETGTPSRLLPPSISSCGGCRAAALYTSFTVETDPGGMVDSPSGNAKVHRNPL